MRAGSWDGSTIFFLWPYLYASDGLSDTSSSPQKTRPTGWPIFIRKYPSPWSQNCSNELPKFTIFSRLELIFQILIFIVELVLTRHLHFFLKGGGMQGQSRAFDRLHVNCYLLRTIEHAFLRQETSLISRVGIIRNFELWRIHFVAWSVIALPVFL